MGDQPMEEEEGPSGLSFDLLDDHMDTLSEAVLDCMPSPPDSAALYRQLIEGTDNLGVDLGGGPYGMHATIGDAGSFMGEPPPAPPLDIFGLPDIPGGGKAEVAGGVSGVDVERPGAEDSAQTGEKSNKKHAPLGQWQTPPQIQYYGSGTSLKKNKSDLDVPSTGGFMMGGDGGYHGGGGGGSVGATYPMAPPFAMPIGDPSTATPLLTTTTFPANFRPPPPGTLARSVSFEGLTTAGYAHYGLHPVMMPYPGLVPVPGPMGLAGFATAQGLPMMTVMTTPQQQQGAMARGSHGNITSSSTSSSSSGSISSMPPPPARHYNNNTGKPMSMPPPPPLTVGTHHQQHQVQQQQQQATTDIGALRRQTLSCPDLTNIAARPTVMPMATELCALTPTTTSESSSASSSTSSPYYPNFTPLAPLPDFSTLQAQGLLPALLPDDVTRSLRALSGSSCPDFNVFAGGSGTSFNKMGAGAEDEDRRQKRLARNRAAARLRRQRKKNLVETYEQEVSCLETNLKKLQHHVWGGEGGGIALEEALGRGKVLDMMTSDEARETADGLVQHQRMLVQPLRDDLETMEVLAAMLSLDSAGSSGRQSDGEEERQLRELRAEMMRDLELTREQESQLHALLGPDPCHDERASVTALEQGLAEVNHRTQWCLRGMDMCQSLVRTGLEKAQLRRFMAWADTNREAIEQLEFCPQQQPSTDDGMKMKVEDAGQTGGGGGGRKGPASSSSSQPPVPFQFFGEGGAIEGQQGKDKDG